MIKKQTRTIIVCGILFILLLVGYIVYSALIGGDESGDTEPPELLQGELLGFNNRIFIYPQIESSDISSIEVHNEFGGYTFYKGYKGDNKTFYIKGMEGAPYSQEALSALSVSTGYTLSLKRLDDPSSDLSDYGLDSSDEPAYFILTRKNGVKHTVYIGDLIPTGGGYYARYEGRDAVYVLDNALQSTVLSDIKTMIQPKLGWPITSSTDYAKIDDFVFVKEGEPFISIDTVIKEGGDTDGGYTYKITYPAGLELQDTAYTSILQIFTDFGGEETVLCGDEITDMTADEMNEKYGIDTKSPYYYIGYKLNDVDTAVFFSKPNDDGYMYAYSTTFNLVAKINLSKLPFLSWNIKEFMKTAVFASDINTVSKITLKGEIKNKAENLLLDAHFVLSGEGEKIKIFENGSETSYDADELKNFRQFYKSLLSIKLRDYADETDISKMELLAELDIEYDDGEKKEIKFYSYSTRRCFYTVNGKGEFYVLRDEVEKIIRDGDRILKDLPVDSDTKN